jgi:hypothetical protein
VNNSLLGKLHTFANRKARIITQMPIMELEIVSLEDSLIGRLYTIVNSHKKIVGYSIALDKEWFYANTGNPRRIKRVICHEIAHIKIPMDHNTDFIKTARRLGAGNDAGEYVDSLVPAPEEIAVGVV